jgi:hypothetical protein
MIRADQHSGRPGSFSAPYYLPVVNLARSMNRCISFEEMLHMEPSLEQRIRERAYEI